MLSALLLVAVFEVPSLDVAQAALQLTLHPHLAFSSLSPANHWAVSVPPLLQRWVRNPSQLSQADHILGMDKKSEDQVRLQT